MNTMSYNAFEKLLKAMLDKDNEAFFKYESYSNKVNPEEIKDIKNKIKTIDSNAKESEMLFPIMYYYHKQKYDDKDISLQEIQDIYNEAVKLSNLENIKKIGDLYFQKKIYNIARMYYIEIGTLFDSKGYIQNGLCHSKDKSYLWALYGYELYLNDQEYLSNIKEIPNELLFNLGKVKFKIATKKIPNVLFTDLSFEERYKLSRKYKKQSIGHFHELLNKPQLDDNLKSKTYYYLGNIAGLNNDFYNASKYYELAITGKNKNKAKFELAKLNIKMSGLNYLADEQKEEYKNEAVIILNKLIDNDKYRNKSNYLLATIYNDANDLKKAIEYYKAAINENNKLAFKWKLANLKLNFITNKDLNVTTKILYKNEIIMEYNNFINQNFKIEESYEALAKLWEYFGNKNQALDCYEKSIKISEANKYYLADKLRRMLDAVSQEPKSVTSEAIKARIKKLLYINRSSLLKSSSFRTIISVLVLSLALPVMLSFPLVGLIVLSLSLVSMVFLATDKVCDFFCNNKMNFFTNKNKTQNAQKTSEQYELNMMRNFVNKYY